MSLGRGGVVDLHASAHGRDRVRENGNASAGPTS